MRYHNITSSDILNGDDLGVVLWVAGCNHHCKGCQNPCTWDPDGGLEFDESAEKEFLSEVAKDYHKRVTFSGGDPIHPANVEKVFELTKFLKENYPSKKIWLYTGSILYELIRLGDIYYELAKLVDVLVDGEYVEELRDTSLPWVGSSNQRVIDMNLTKESGEIKIYNSTK